MDKYLQCCNPELWGGIECTINRVGDVFYDQLHAGGHYNRNGYLEAIAALGISALRFPILWERHEPSLNTEINWQWAESQIKILQELNIKPIVGLVHHGSGPAYTNLLDNNFPELLASYAAKVAARFPFITHYTPVNEPLTTARFSGLYGHWYPHKNSDKAFLRILINQLRAVVLSIKAIREVNSEAKLIQTEDLGFTHSTPTLKYQGAFENERRWLTYDLLTGSFDKHHYLYNYLITAGIKEHEIAFFSEQKCSPEIAGFNYYVTSERYLDHRIYRHPPHTHGGNNMHKYADVEAVRMRSPKGLEALLKEAWNRFRLPMAVTEAHLHCTRDEQMRWFGQVWKSACNVTQQGIDVRAVTAWSLLGAYDWNSLLTRFDRKYERGVFDITGSEIRKTAMAGMLSALSSQNKFKHPVIEAPGWWEMKSIKKKRQSINHVRPILIIGKTGTLATAFAEICRRRRINFLALDRSEISIHDERSVTNAILNYRPWAMINTTGYVKVDAAEQEADCCYLVNAKAPGVMAKVCAEHNVHFSSFSSDLVFGGDKHAPYQESDGTMPLNVYGRSKVDGEKNILAENANALIIRTSSFFGPWDKYNFAHFIEKSLPKPTPVVAVNDVVMSPTYVPDLVNTTLDLVIDGEKNIWHITNEGELSWYDFARAIAKKGGYDEERLVPKSAIEMNWIAQRPLYSAMASSRGLQLPALDHAIDRYFTEKIC